MSQPAPPAISGPAGCEIQQLEPNDIEAYVAWLLCEPDAVVPDSASGLKWALAHCDDGVTWGRRTGPDSPGWCFGSQFFLEACPAIRRERLQELRIFGKDAEVLIWRAGVGLRGRVLRESDPRVDRNDPSNPLRPSDECRIIRGDPPDRDETHIISKSGFSQITDRAGAEQVIPIEVSAQQLRKRSVRLCVTHYYEHDDESGSVRIAATRLVNLTAGDTTNGS